MHRGQGIAGNRRVDRLKHAVNQALRGTVGYQLTKAVPGTSATTSQPADRLVPRPTFILATARSGSTLLRLILDSHSQICAPHELHFRLMNVRIGDTALRDKKEVRRQQRSLEYLLWDRVLHRQLTASGKRLIVEKTPNNVFSWERLTEAWPRARFIFLLRHPAAIADSLERWHGEPRAAVIERVRVYTAKLEEARSNLPGLTVTYEDLVTDPAATVRRVCEFLGVPFEPQMLRYGEHQHGPFVARLGDTGSKIQSGRIDGTLALPAADGVPEPLRDISRAWGYLP